MMRTSKCWMAAGFMGRDYITATGVELFEQASVSVGNG